MVKSIVIAGVGGQGTLLASRLIGAVATDSGHDVKVSEVHGMAQRGGSVITYVRYGENVISPIIPLGEADYILAFEQLEAFRWTPYLKKGGTLIMNTQKIEPMPVIIGTVKYPEDIEKILHEKVENCYSLDALSLAIQAGSRKAVNCILIGKLAKMMDFDKSIWVDAIKKTVPQKFIDMNIKAFELGYNA